MANVFKSQLVLVNNKLPFVPERRPKAVYHDNNSKIPDAAERMDAIEEIISKMLEKAEIETFDIINRANNEAQEILTQSLIQSDNIKEEARIKGYELSLIHI